MTKQEKGTRSCFLPHKKNCYFLLKQELNYIMNYLKLVLSYLFIKKNNNQGDTFESENEDYVICKALAELCDRKFVEEQKAFYGLEAFDF
jgi:hypothetical protein